MKRSPLSSPRPPLAAGALCLLIGVAAFSASSARAGDGADGQESRKTAVSKAELDPTDGGRTSDHPTYYFAKTALKAASQSDYYFRTGQYPLAIRMLTAATIAQPHDTVLHEMLGVTLIAGDQPVQAVYSFRDAVQQADDDPVAAMLLQSALAAQGDANEAQKLDHEIYRRFGRGTGANRVIDASRSIARLTAHAALQPDSAVLQLLLGDAYQLQQDWENASRSYNKAARITPLWAKPLINRGLAESSQGNYAMAIDTFNKALHLDPANVQAKVGLGDADLGNGRYEHAINTLRGVVADRNNVNPAVRGQAAMIMGQAYSRTQKYASAVASLDEAQRLAPSDPTPSAMLGDVQREAGNYEAATDAYQNAIRLTDGSSLFSSRSVLFRALAVAQISAHRPDDALATLRQAMAADPASDSVWHRLTAQAQFDRGNATAGQEELCQSIDSEDDSYPIDTLNAASARSLLPTVEAHYRSLLQSAGGGEILALPEAIDKASSVGSGLMARNSLPVASAAPIAPSVKIRIRPDINDAAQAKSDRIRALSALAHIARYQNHTTQEIELRRQLTTLRTRATDWYLLAEAYDDRAQMPIPAREAYKQALELGQGLNPAQIARATKRLSILTGPAYKP